VDRASRSVGGVLFAHESVSIDAISDGASNTLLLGEQSAWMQNDSGVLVDCRSDGNHGFTMGTSPTDNRRFNLTTVRHPINELSISRAVGSAGNTGLNRPFHSEHPGGVLVSNCDGSTHFLSDFTALDLLFNFADRDDGQVASFE